MAKQNNAGQFGNRQDTQEQASKGGQASTGSFDDRNGADASAAGKKGAQAQPRRAKVEGGKNSHSNDR